LDLPKIGLFSTRLPQQSASKEEVIARGCAELVVEAVIAGMGFSLVHCRMTE